MSLSVKKLKSIDLPCSNNSLDFALSGKINCQNFWTYTEMNVIEALHNRVSAPRLGDPGPDKEVLENICKSAFSAADHGLLKPWRFLIVKDQARYRLGDLFAQATLETTAEVSQEKLESIKKKPLRAPLIIITIAKQISHPKIPEIEQSLSAAAATQNMLLAAFSQGIGAMWRTGPMAYSSTVSAGLGIEKHEKIIGFLYLGASQGPQKPPREYNLDDFFQEW